MRIAVINVSTCVSDADVERFVKAAQLSATRDFCPIWHCEAPEIIFYAKGTPPPGPDSDAWQIIITDNSDQVGALGYHELTAGGWPIAFCFAKTDVDAGTSWTVTASHELWEMLGDPWINTTVEIDHSDGTVEFRPLEVSDCCEDDSLGYMVDVGDGGPKVLLSDFVTPQYFQANAPKNKAYDLEGHVTAPLQLLPGGYTMVLMGGTGGWTQVQARAGVTTSKRSEMEPGGKAIEPGSRRWRRIKSDSSWQKSLV